MIYTALDNFYLTDEQLASPPSVKEGEIDAETEFKLRIYGCELIQEGGVLLKLYPLHPIRFSAPFLIWHLRQLGSYVLQRPLFLIATSFTLYSTQPGVFLKHECSQMKRLSGFSMVLRETVPA